MKEKQNKTKKGKVLKPIAIAGLSLAMACSLSACGNDKDKNANKDSEVPAIIWTADNAYTQAKAEGFTGTFEEFLATLAGITKVETDTNGHLKVTLSDGSVVDAGKVTGEKGKDGVSITGIERLGQTGLITKYRINFSNNHYFDFDIVNGKDGVDGEKGDQGEAGVGIANIKSKTDRWGLVTTTTYTYTDSTEEKPHIETFTVNNGAQFGRLYDVKTSEEISYLLENGVTNFALLNDIEVKTAETLKATEVGTLTKVMTDYDSESSQAVYSNVYINYTFDLNGHTLTVPTTYPLTVEDGLNVLFKNGTMIVNDDSIKPDKTESENIHFYFDENINIKAGVVSANELTTVINNNYAYDEVVLLADIDYEGYFTVSKKVTLDLNGKTVKGNGNCGVFHVVEGGDLTITGNGKVIAVASSNEIGRGDTDTSHTVYAMAVWAYGGNVTIENGTFSNETVTGQTIGDGNSESNTQTKDNLDLIYAKDNNNKTSSIVIKGGTFNCVQKMWTLNINNDSKSTIKVQGGTFIGYDPSVGDNGMSEDKTNKVLLAEGYEAVLVEGSTTDYKVVKKA